MVMLVVAHRLVVGAVAAEVGPEQETVVDQDLERPVDRRSVDAGKPLAHSLHDVLRAQVPARLGHQHLPDHAALARESPSAPAQRRGVVGHEPIMNRIAPCGEWVAIASDERGG